MKKQITYLYASLRKQQIMKTTANVIILLILTILFHSRGASQTVHDSALYHIETADGNEFFGKIVKSDSVFTFRAENYGLLEIPQAFIRKMKIIEGEKIIDGRYWPENPQSARYFWAPNGYGLDAGEGYYQNVWVLFNQVSLGLTDNVSLGAGFVPLFLFGGAPTPVWITPKVSVPVMEERMNLGGGVMMGTVIGGDDTGFGILYGTFTYGSRDYNASLGIGYGYAGHDWTKYPVVNASGMFRTGPRGYIVTENYFFRSNEVNLALISFGGRQIIKKASIDYGLFIPIEEDIDEFVAVPWLGLVVPIGKKVR